MRPGRACVPVVELDRHVEAGQHRPENRHEDEDGEDDDAAERLLVAIDRSPEIGESLAHDLSLLQLDARIQPGIDQVRGEIGDDDRDARHEQQSLHERIIPLLGRLADIIAHAGIAEHVLDQRRAAQHEAEVDRQRRNERQHRVALHVLAHERALGYAADAGGDDVVLAEHVDGAALHRQRPCSERRDDIGQNRERPVIEHVRQERQIEAGLHDGIVSSVHGEPAELEGEHDEQQNRDDEVRDGRSDDGVDGDDRIQQALPAERHHRAEIDADQKADDERDAEHEQRPGQRVRYDLIDRYVLVDHRHAEVAVQQSAEISAELSQQRFVRIVVDHGGDLAVRLFQAHPALGRVIARPRVDGAAWSHAQQHKGEQHREQDGDGRHSDSFGNSSGAHDLHLRR
ncbi:hypothetical protein BN871_FY_00270 [Paenibacillus sp. P22]|nr:hypothetical protein BN871_FY_00270 [Paenibacillus sp. P22]